MLGSLPPPLRGAKSAAALRPVGPSTRVSSTRSSSRARGFEQLQRVARHALATASRRHVTAAWRTWQLAVLAQVSARRERAARTGLTGRLSARPVPPRARTAAHAARVRGAHPSARRVARQSVGGVAERARGAMCGRRTPRAAARSRLRQTAARRRARDRGRRSAARRDRVARVAGRGSRGEASCSAQRARRRHVARRHAALAARPRRHGRAPQRCTRRRTRSPPRGTTTRGDGGARSGALASRRADQFSESGRARAARGANARAHRRSPTRCACAAPTALRPRSTAPHPTALHPTAHRSSPRGMTTRGDGDARGGALVSRRARLCTQRR